MTDATITDGDRTPTETTGSNITRQKCNINELSLLIFISPTVTDVHIV